MSNTALELTQKAREIFMDSNRDLLALVRSGADDVFRRIAASLALDAQAQSDCLLYADILDQPSKNAREQAQDDFRNSMTIAICRSYLRIARNGVISYVSKLTPEAREQLENIEILAGERAPRPVVPPPPPPLSAEEQLDAQIKDDWAHLPYSAVMAKCRTNPTYKARLDQIMADLPSTCTSYQDIGEGLR